MRTAKELVDKINNSELTSPCFLADDLGVEDVTEVAVLNRDEHRWYVMGTVVFKIGDEFFGVRGPIMLKSESMSWRDVGQKCEAFEMEQFPSVTYREKK